MNQIDNHRDTEAPSNAKSGSARYEHDPLTQQIIGAAIDVHKHLGPGLLESIYEECMCHELQLRQLSFQRQVPMPLVYKGCTLASPLRIDLIVEGRVVVELKSVDRLLGLHQAQLLTYMRLTGLRFGLLLNFNSSKLTEGIKRMAL